MLIRRSVLVAALVVIGCLPSRPIPAQEGRVTAVSQARFSVVVAALEQAIADHKMALVCHADAQRGAAARGVSIKGNRVVMVFRNDYAVRSIAADPSAGFEAPLRIYVYENTDGTSTVSYTPPSVVFAPYHASDVRAVAAELDPILRAIVDQALAAR